MADVLAGPSLRLSTSPGERRLALLRGGVLEEAWIERPARPDGVGDVLVGRIAARAPALSGAFVALPGGESGFLPDAQGGEGRHEGEHLALRVTRAPQGGKGPRLAALRNHPPVSPPLRLLSRGPDAAARLLAAHPGAALLCDSGAEAARLRAMLAESGGDPARVTLRLDPAFDDALEAEFDALARPLVPLPGGGRIRIEPTAALTAIDVDSGSAAGGRDRDAHRRLNLAALSAAARQIRLRRLAGPILIDLAGQSPRARAALLPALREAAAGDPLLRVLGITGLGLFECVRTRVHPPLHEVLAGPLTPGLAALRRLEREARTVPGRRPSLRAHPGVVAALRDLPGALEEAGGPALRPDPALQPGEETIDRDP